MPPSIEKSLAEGAIRLFMDPLCASTADDNGPLSKKSAVKRAERACADAPERTANVPSPYPDSYSYCRIPANEMYYGGGDSDWANSVRGCLVCMHDEEIHPHQAHEFCYSRATEASSFCGTMRGYGEAIDQASKRLAGRQLKADLTALCEATADMGSRFGKSVCDFVRSRDVK